MGKKQKKPKNGLLDVYFNKKEFSGTLLITSMRDEAQTYYAAINPHTGYNWSTATLWLPPGNYILKIMGKDETRLISVTEEGYSKLDWEM